VAQRSILHNSTFRFTQGFHLALLIIYVGVRLLLESEKNGRKKRRKKMEGGYLMTLSGYQTI
jgi:hypothetical protein